MYKDPPHFSWDMLSSADDAPVKLRDTIQGENALAHSHDFIEIAMVHHGKGTHINYFPNGKVIVNTIIKGDVFVIMPGEKHGYANCRGFGVYNICIRQDFFRSLDMELCNLKHFSSFFISRAADSAKQLHLLPEAFFAASAKLRRLSQACRITDCSRNLAIRLVLTDYIYSVFGGESLSWELDGSIINQALFQSIIQLEANPEKHFDLNAVSRQAGMSSSSYSHKFKQATGVSPGDYCLFLKLDKARKLLENKHLPLGEVALLCGFTDSNYMIRAFKKRFGITPGKYRGNCHRIDK